MQRAGVDGLFWTAETLDAYIENPRVLVSKTRMSYRGMKKPEDRANLLAYLRIYSDNPADIPEAERPWIGTLEDHADRFPAPEDNPALCFSRDQIDVFAKAIVKQLRKAQNRTS